MSKMMFVVLHNNVASMTGKKTIVAAAFDSQGDANMWVEKRLRKADYEIREAQMQIEFSYTQGESELMDLCYSTEQDRLVLRAAINKNYPRSIQLLRNAYEATGVPVKFTYEE